MEGKKKGNEKKNNKIENGGRNEKIEKKGEMNKFHFFQLN